MFVLSNKDAGPSLVQLVNPKPKVNKNNRYYTKDEVSFLKENYFRKPAYLIANRLGRSVHSVHKKAEKLGLIKHSSRIKWSTREDRILAIGIENDLLPEDIQKQLSNEGFKRTMEAIHTRTREFARNGVALKPVEVKLRDSSVVEHGTHNAEVAGSSPAPASIHDDN
jgi:hypothetical protein